MPKIPMNNSSKDRELLMDECLAYKENEHRDLITSMRNRTMTRKTYRNLMRHLREFCWRVEQRNAIGM